MKHLGLSKKQTLSNGVSTRYRVFSPLSFPKRWLHTLIKEIEWARKRKGKSKGDRERKGKGTEKDNKEKTGIEKERRNKKEKDKEE